MTTDLGQQSRPPITLPPHGCWLSHTSCVAPSSRRMEALARNQEKQLAALVHCRAAACLDVSGLAVGTQVLLLDSFDVHAAVPLAPSAASGGVCEWGCCCAGTSRVIPAQALLNSLAGENAASQ